MGQVRFHKVVSALPSPLEKDGLYLVRTGEGFDLYASDSTGAIAHKVNTGTGTGTGTQPPADLLDYERNKDKGIYPSFGTRIVSKVPLKLQFSNYGTAGINADFLQPKSPPGGWKVGQSYTLSVLTHVSVRGVEVRGDTKIKPVPQFTAIPLGDQVLYTATFTWPAGVTNYFAPLDFKGPAGDTAVFYDFKLEEGEQSTLLPFEKLAGMSLNYLRSQVSFDTGWRDLSSEVRGFQEWSDKRHNYYPDFLFAEKNSRVLVRRVGDRAFICLDFTASIPPTDVGGVLSYGVLPPVFRPEVTMVLQRTPSAEATNSVASFSLTDRGAIHYANDGQAPVKPTPVVIEYRVKRPGEALFPLPGVPAQTRN